MRLSSLPLVLLIACANDVALNEIVSAPSVVLESPLDGQEFGEDTPVSLLALVGDDIQRPIDLDIHWQSSIDGDIEPLPTTADGVSEASVWLSPGEHRIAITAIDGDGLSSQAEVSIRVLDLPDAPELTVVRPLVGEDGFEGDAYELSALMTDDRDPVETLDFRIVSDLDGEVCNPLVDPLGEGRCEVVLSLGRHRLSFEATDSEGNLGREEVFLRIISRDAIDDDGDGWSEDQGDCDDTDSSVLPGAEEFCDGIDSNCDGLIDEGTVCFDDDGDGQTELDGDCNDDDASIYLDAPDTWYDGIDSDCRADDDFDQDGDGVSLDDCDDTDPLVFPGAPEICNGIDSDCDDTIDEGTACYDDDGDGQTEDEGDCNDADASIYLDATETWYDGIDSDCRLDDDYDADGDGFTEDVDCDDFQPAINPDGIESCNGYDDDCDGDIDGGLTNAYYLDNDGDGYGRSSSVVHACSLPAGYVTNPDDCYDNNSAARPGNPNFYNVHRGDGSFDYNCANGQERSISSQQWDTWWSWGILYAQPGWFYTVPGCGQTDGYATGTNIIGTWPSHEYPRTMTCR